MFGMFFETQCTCISRNAATGRPIHWVVVD